MEWQTSCITFQFKRVPGGQVHPVWPGAGFGAKSASGESSIHLSTHPPALHRLALSAAHLHPDQMSYPGGGQVMQKVIYKGSDLISCLLDSQLFNFCEIISIPFSVILRIWTVQQNLQRWFFQGRRWRNIKTDYISIHMQITKHIEFDKFCQTVKSLTSFVKLVLIITGHLSAVSGWSAGPVDTEVPASDLYCTATTLLMLLLDNLATCLTKWRGPTCVP